MKLQILRHYQKRPVENIQVNSPTKRIPVRVPITKPQLSKSLFGAPKRIPASNTNISQPLSQSRPAAVVRPKSSIGVYRATVRPNNEESVRPKSVQSNHQPSTGLRRTNLTLGGAQRILKKPEPVKKAKVESKIPLQSQNRTTKTPFVKPVATQPTAKVSSGMPTPNSKRTVSMIPTQQSKRPHSPPSESIPVKDTTKLPKPTRSNTSNFSRPTASSNARVSATTEELRRKESSTRSLAANSKVRKVIGTTGPLRVLRGN
ncbi:hypothetical protein K7432_017796 [Basidiobolus ranarum]|uniref:Uncharacterized protein n=1 Tax=Basidiobolus ranarum TaxID=34480 RepID=A0ABR2WCX6_9FUNG